LNTQTGGDILPTTPITPYTPLPPPYPPSPSYHFGGQKGGIMLLIKRVTLKKISGKIFLKNQDPLYNNGGMYIFIYMKILITESQNNVLWVKRRFDIVEKEYEYAINHFNEYNICERYESFDDFFEMFGYLLYNNVYDMVYYEEGEIPEGLDDSLKELFRERIHRYYQDRCS